MKCDQCNCEPLGRAKIQVIFSQVRVQVTMIKTNKQHLKFLLALILWRAVCFKIIFVSCTIFILCTHHSVGCSCTGYKLAVINLHSVGCTHSSVPASCKYLQCPLYTLLSQYSVGCMHYSITCKIYFVSCMHYSVACKYLLCRLYALLCRL